MYNRIVRFPLVIYISNTQSYVLSLTRLFKLIQNIITHRRNYCIPGNLVNVVKLCEMYMIYIYRGGGGVGVLCTPYNGTSLQFIKAYQDFANFTNFKHFPRVANRTPNIKFLKWGQLYKLCKF